MLFHFTLAIRLRGRWGSVACAPTRDPSGMNNSTAHLRFASAAGGTVLPVPRLAIHREHPFPTSFSNLLFQPPFSTSFSSSFFNIHFNRISNPPFQLPFSTSFSNIFSNRISNPLFQLPFSTSFPISFSISFAAAFFTLAIHLRLS